MNQDNISTKLTGFLECIVEWVGKAASWLIMVLIISIVYEVISRFLFNAPTFWSYDISYMVGGTAMVLGSAWTLKVGQHVRVDIFYYNFSPKVQAVIDIVISFILLFPVIAIGLIYSVPEVIFSWSRHERIYSGVWNPPIYHVKTFIALAMFLLLIQGISELIKNVQKLRQEGRNSNGG